MSNAIGRLQEAEHDQEGLSKEVDGSIAQIKAQMTVLDGHRRLAETMISVLQVIGTDVIGNIDALAEPIRSTEMVMRNVEQAYANLQAGVTVLEDAQKIGAAAAAQVRNVAELLSGLGSL